MALHAQTVLLAATLEQLEHPNVAIAPKASMLPLWDPQRVHSALLVNTSRTQAPQLVRPALLVITSRTQAPQPVPAVVLGTPQMVL